jgi:uncharacterized protein involved in type VI secretion and phage assembly
MAGYMEGTMNILPNISKWSVSLVVFCILAVALTATRPTHAQDATLPGLHPALGLARALVVDVRDPEAAGRIKIKFPWLLREVETWAHVSLPLGGNRTGLWALPEVGDQVIVGFEHGDVRSPIIIGSLWDGTPPPSR